MMTDTNVGNDSFTQDPEVNTRIANHLSTTTPDKSDQEDSGVSLLWLPYLILGAVLIGMTIASFTKYHIKNRERYKNRTATIISQGSPFDEAQTERAQKYTVTPGVNGIQQHIPLEVLYHHYNNGASLDNWRDISLSTKHLYVDTRTSSYHSSYDGRSSYQNPAFDGRESDGELYEKGRRVTPEGSQAHSLTSQYGPEHMDHGESRRGHLPIIKDDYNPRYHDGDVRTLSIHNPQIHRSALPPTPELSRHREHQPSPTPPPNSLRDDYIRAVERYNQQTPEEREYRVERSLRWKPRVAMTLTLSLLSLSSWLCCPQWRLIWHHDNSRL